jgi:signal transduction histidine kinase
MNSRGRQQDMVSSELWRSPSSHGAPGLFAVQRPWKRTLAAALLGAACVAVFVLAAVRASGSPAPRESALAGESLIAALAILLSFTALIYLRSRTQWRRRERALNSKLLDLRARLDRAEMFFASEPQIVISWMGASADPEFEGDFGFFADDSDARQILSFGSWLAPAMAEHLETCVARLRATGKSFRINLTALSGRHIEADGRPVSGRAILRIRDVSGDRLEAVRLEEARSRTEEDLKAVRALLDALPNPAWARDAEEKLTWVNAAYARSVEARDQFAAAQSGAELLERPAREASAGARAAGAVWRGRAAAVAAGERRIFDIVEAPAEGASVGLATDLSEIESLRGALEREARAHAETLDQLSTAVAIFDRSKRLVFHNAAYRQLWALDQAWLEQIPTDSEILDRLRAARLLPEQADYRAWKANLLAAYQSIETDEQAWYLPDGRTLRIVVNPNPQGGVTYLFDDVTERFQLESRFNALTRVQGETLDALKEGVAVFGSDGRMKLCNPAFAQMWTLAPGQLDGAPHIDRVAQLCAPAFADETAWDDLRAVVAGLQDQRTGFERRLARSDNTVLDCAAAPLPDGATLLTFIDATAGVNVEKALTERNQALIDAEKLRNDFVHHVSYELRSPLTNIIGFIQLLGDAAVGPLNPKQLEYAGYVMKSSSALLAIINDILDLASIDADAMELTLEEVDIAQTMRAAAEGVQDRLDESNLTLHVLVAEDIGSFSADGKRIRQILFNLLSNAIGFSTAGQTVELVATRREREVEFKVSDRGRGIPPDVIEHVFDRFRTHTSGSRHRGVGLGLSIVRSFVELHGGRISIQSFPGQGTSVTCVFPLQGAKLDQVKAAQEE